jgi:hypothetical protein
MVDLVAKPLLSQLVCLRGVSTTAALGHHFYDTRFNQTGEYFAGCGPRFSDEKASIGDIYGARLGHKPNQVPLLAVELS